MRDLLEHLQQWADMWPRAGSEARQDLLDAISTIRGLYVDAARIERDLIKARGRCAHLVNALQFVKQHTAHTEHCDCIVCDALNGPESPNDGSRARQDLLDEATRIENLSTYSARIERELIAARGEVAKLRRISNVNGDWTVKVDNLQREKAALEVYLTDAIAMMEETPEAEEVGSDWWTLIHQAREQLRSIATNG